MEINEQVLPPCCYFSVITWKHMGCGRT